MKKKQYVVFDFDGTLADTLDLVFNIFNGFAHEYQFKPVTWEDKENIRSKKPQELLKIYGISYLRLFTLILRIRKELAHHIRDTKLVEEMRDSLVALRNAGYRMGILTSNSKENVSRFLGYQSLAGLFDFIYSGNSLFGKDKVLRRMLERENIPSESMVYVGDETRDIEACKKIGIPVIAVSWGLNRRELLASLHPEQLADHPRQLLPLLQRIFCAKTEDPGIAFS